MPARNRRLMIVGITIAGIVALGCFVRYWLEISAFAIDFSTWPPDRVYTMAVGQPPPAGITEIRASGRHYFTKRWVWLRLHGDSAALRSLESAIRTSGDPLTPEAAQQALANGVSANHRYDEVDEEKVGWFHVSGIAHPVYYQRWFGTGNPWLWHGLFVFDHSTNTVYIEASGG